MYSCSHHDISRRRWLHHQKWGIKEIYSNYRPVISYRPVIIGLMECQHSLVQLVVKNLTSISAASPEKRNI